MPPASTYRERTGPILSETATFDDKGDLRVVIRARLIGAIEAKQRKTKGKWARNDRLLAVACRAQTHDGTPSIDGLRPHLVKEIRVKEIRAATRRRMMACSAKETRSAKEIGALPPARGV
jgi:hypothetical protein